MPEEVKQLMRAVNAHTKGNGEHMDRHPAIAPLP
jgi:hypothetical protein